MMVVLGGCKLLLSQVLMLGGGRSLLSQVLANPMTLLHLCIYGLGFTLALLWNKGLFCAALEHRALIAAFWNSRTDGLAVAGSTYQLWAGTPVGRGTGTLFWNAGTGSRRLLAVCLPGCF